MPKTGAASAASDEVSAEERAEADVRRLVIEAVANAIEPLISLAKRPFFISDSAAAKLQAAFEELVDECIDDDGDIDMEAVEAKEDVFKALFQLVGK